VSFRDSLLACVDTNIVHQHSLRKGGVEAFWTSRQIPANRKVQYDEKGMVGKPGFAGRNIGGSSGRIKLAVHVKTYSSRFPFGSENVKVIANVSSRKSEVAGY